jgi:SAM-dependent methyltransferase
VEECCRDLPPGRAIDLAAGEGRNAVWLAERGWEVTAVDFSAVATTKAAAVAAGRGVALTVIRADLTTWVPPREAYDLVMIAYLQLPRETERAVVAGAAAAVAPGGHFLFVAHDASNLEHGHGGPTDPAVLPDVELVSAVLEGYDLLRAEVVERPVPTGDGERTALDTLVLARRAGG